MSRDSQTDLMACHGGSTILRGRDDYTPQEARAHGGLVGGKECHSKRIL